MCNTSIAAAAILTEQSCFSKIPNPSRDIEETVQLKQFMFNSMSYQDWLNICCWTSPSRIFPPHVKIRRLRHWTVGDIIRRLRHWTVGDLIRRLRHWTVGDLIRAIWHEGLWFLRSRSEEQHWGKQWILRKCPQGKRFYLSKYLVEIVIREFPIKNIDFNWWDSSPYRVIQVN